MDYEHYKLEWIKSYESYHGNTACKAMRDSLKRAKESNSKQTWWLSFCDPDKPKGSLFLGVIIVEAVDFVDAHCKTQFLGINPGGEIQGIDITENAHKVKPEYKNRLLSKEEALSFDKD